MTIRSVRFWVIAVFAAVLALFAGAVQAQQTASDARPPKLNYTKHTLEKRPRSRDAPPKSLRARHQRSSLVSRRLEEDERPGRTGFGHLPNT